MEEKTREVHEDGIVRATSQVEGAACPTSGTVIIIIGNAMDCLHRHIADHSHTTAIVICQQQHHSLALTEIEC